MAQKRKKKKIPSRWKLWSALHDDTRHRLVMVSVFVVIAVAIAGGTSYGIARLDSHIDGLLLSEVDQATFTFVDLPRSLVSLAGGDLEASLDGVRNHRWTSEDMCRQVAKAIDEVGWIARVDSVRRRAAGRFEIRATYREPAALVQLEDYFLLVDRSGVRLPGRYAYDPRWPVIQGIAAAAPGPGLKWSGGDLRAGLAVIDSIAHEPFSGQVTGVLVGNFGGRVDPRASHIELATDRAGGRIRWGSAPGLEVEENLVPHKVAILRQNYQRTGRLDAGYPVIDISTFADRFTVPR